MNLGAGLRGWKDWFVKYGDKIQFDEIELNAHVGVWIFALTEKKVKSHLRDAIMFLKKRGHKIHSVEVGYPTCGHKPPAGLFGWGREKDQTRLLQAAYHAIHSCEVPYMQIYELKDPGERAYEFHHGGKQPSFLGIPVREEITFGLCKKDGKEKQVCGWVRKVNFHKE